MTKVLLRLKRLLDRIPEYELEDMELWVDNADTVEIIAMDEDAITLITDKSKVKINDLEW